MCSTKEKAKKTSLGSISEQVVSLLEEQSKQRCPIEEDEFDKDGPQLCSNFHEDIQFDDLPSLREIVLSDSDPKYGGKIVSRTAIEEEREEEDIGSDQEEDGSTSEEEEREEDSEGDESLQSDDDIESSDREEKDEEIVHDTNTPHIADTIRTSISEEDRDIGLFSSEQKNVDDFEKGTAIKHQLALWDGLLEGRIKLQKCLSLSNELPQTYTAHQFQLNGGNMTASKIESCESILGELMTELTTLQSELMDKNNDLQIKREEEGEEDGDGDNYERLLQERYQSLLPFRDETLEKWNTKLQLATGKLTMKSYTHRRKSILTSIQQTLTDRPKLLKRTQLKRSINRILGKKLITREGEGKEREREGREGEGEGREGEGVRECESNAHLRDYDEEIFNDEDFYHQLLKELIQSKTVDTTQDQITMGRKWLEIQSLRTKVKKKVDTKASKGRRLRYQNLQKLSGFMAPFTNSSSNMYCDSARYNLFSSLFDSRKDM